jgi:hypothetical protein
VTYCMYGSVYVTRLFDQTVRGRGSVKAVYDDREIGDVGSLIYILETIYTRLT